MEEAQLVICGAIEGLLNKQGAQQQPAGHACAAQQLCGMAQQPLHRGQPCARARAACSSLTAAHALLPPPRLTGLAPKDVDIIVTTCSIFCPTPSLTSMVVNHFKMRTDVQSYHLGGMGCSNGVVAVNLIKDLLRVSRSAGRRRGRLGLLAAAAGSCR